MMKLCRLVLLQQLLLATAPHATFAMFPEDAGRLDFLIATAGHGSINFALASIAKEDDSSSSSSVITSDATEVLGDDETATTSCYIASRDISSGSLNWRRNVCSEGGDNGGAAAHAHAVAADATSLVTLDRAGVVRSWDLATGNFNWETIVQQGSNNKVSISMATTSSADEGDKSYVIISGKDTTALDAATGKVTNEAAKAVTQAMGKKESEIPCGELGKVSLDNEKKGLLHNSENVISTDMVLSESDVMDGLYLLSCADATITFLVTTDRGTTTLLTFKPDGDTELAANTKWTAEEGLSSVSTGMLLDASHFVEEEEKGYDKLLTFSSRLFMHFKALTALTDLAFLNDDSVASEFGFKKIAVLVSNTAARIYGIHTSGEHRSSIKYQYDLPISAEWHRAVHGAPNTVKSVRGINGKAHSREVLVISSVPTSEVGNTREISWLCLEGATGHVHGQGSIQVASPVSQILPVASAGSLCRQGAILVLQDLTTAVLPNNESTQALAVSHVASSSTNGFFAHRLDKENAALEALRLDADNQSLTAQVSGLAQFPGETIVSVAYPQRDEVIQSPCNVLGDQSLLLKFLNPHMVVIMTMTADKTDNKDLFSTAMKTSSDIKGSKQKRKPAGATAANTPETQTSFTEDEPNLFVNVVDSVSGRVLYRASHSNAVLIPKPSILVSENWVFYSFMNERTRRAEMGVLSLYEGMVDSKGLTAFNTPDQLTEFSSLDARESKPVVLAKTYSLPKPVTALGISLTRTGISGKRLIMACTDGQVYAANRQMLEPRRPIGQVKETEKEEGLQQYSEMIPMVSYMSLSYTQTVEGVKQIVSAPTDLESQTFIMAFGGPDIFFVRTSPSRGFDLLPESFNRTMLSIVVVVLIAGALFLRRIVFNKTVKKGWV